MGPRSDDVLEDIVAQTAEFRYRICWAGARRLVQELGVDPMSCIQTSCDHGDDVAGTLVLPDGRVISFDMRDDPDTRELVSISRWDNITPGGTHDHVARTIVLGGNTAQFDERVRAYFERNWKVRDAPLPPRTRRT